MNKLVENYHAVVSQLRNLAGAGEVSVEQANRAADFISERADNDDVRAQFEAIETEYAAQLSTADEVKGRGSMSFRVEAIDDARSKVVVEVAATEKAEDAQALFDSAQKVYEAIFGDRMSDYHTNIHASPRQCTFEVTGELKDLFDCWQLNRQPEKEQGVA